MVAQPFGGRAAPLCCRRILRALTFLAARLFGIAATDYVDDVNGCEPRATAVSALVSWKQLVNKVFWFPLEDLEEGIWGEAYRSRCALRC